MQNRKIKNSLLQGEFKSAECDFSSMNLILYRDQLFMPT